MLDDPGGGHDVRDPKDRKAGLNLQHFFLFFFILFSLGFSE